MRKARIVALILTLAVPIPFLIGTVIAYRRGAVEVDQGNSPYLERVLDTRLEAWVRAQKKDFVSPTHPQYNEIVAAHNRLVRIETGLLKKYILCLRGELPKKNVQGCGWQPPSGERDQLPPELRSLLIQSGQPEVQSIVMQSEQQAKKDWLAQVLRDRLQLLFTSVAPVFGIGLLTVWVLRPGHAQKRLRVVAQVALVVWTVFMALRLAFGDWPPLLFRAELTRAIALWVGGAAPLLAILYWTREWPHH